MPSTEFADVGIFDRFEGDRIVLEGHRVLLLKDRFQILFDLRIEMRLDQVFASQLEAFDVSLFHHDVAPLEHVPRIAKQEPAVRLVVVNADVGVGPYPQVPLALHPQGPRRPR